jgi:hypothetical protein
MNPNQWKEQLQKNIHDNISLWSLDEINEVHISFRIFYDKNIKLLIKYLCIFRFTFFKKKTIKT